MMTPADTRPMSEFVEHGWIHELNRLVAHPLGVHVGLWLDDDRHPDGTVGDGRAVLGWQVIPLAAAELVLAPLDDTIARQAAFRAHILDILGGPRDQAP
jgi:hypothetical protein